MHVDLEISGFNSVLGAFTRRTFSFLWEVGWKEGEFREEFSAEIRN